MRPGSPLTAGRILLFLLLAGTTGFEAPGDRGASRTIQTPTAEAGLPASRAEGAAALEERARRHLAETERLHGALAAETAAALDELVAALAAHRDPPRLDEALLSAERAGRIREQLLGAEHPEVAASLSGTVHVLWPLEQYDALLPLARRALAIRRRALGERHTKTAASLYQTAELLRMTGDYAASRRLHEDALSIWEAAGEERGVAASLYYLGFLRWSTGDLEAARGFIERSLAIRERVLGPDHEEVAACLKSLGTLAVQRGDAAGARPLLERALAAWERALGPDDPQLARALSDLGRLLIEAGDLERARELFRRAADLRSRALGDGHPLVALSLVDLAALAEERGDDEEAAGLYQRALAIEERDPGARGLNLVGTTLAFASLQWRRGDAAGALDRVLRAESLAREHFLRTSRGLQEREALRYESVLARGLGAALSILGDAGEAMPGRSAARPPPGSEGRILDEVIRSRAMVLQQQARRPGAPDDEPEAPGAWPGRREVEAALPDEAALVAYVRHPVILRLRGEPAGDAYTAVVLPARGESIAIVPLGPAAGIEVLVEAWRREAGVDPRLVPGRDAERAARDAGRRLREAVWDPVFALVRGARSVFVVPDGALGLVGFGTLPVPGGRYLVESGQRLHYLTAERDLALLSPPRSAPGERASGVLVIGGPDFDAPPAPVLGGAEASGRRPVCPLLESLTFPPLPGARAEAVEVESLWRPGGEVAVLTGRQATESAFRALAPGRRVLHLATHGFSLYDRCRPSPGRTAKGGGAQDAGDDPPALSGLALAGANRGRDIVDAERDGVLTVEEIAALDLSQVDWAVLSACETGLGEVTSGEGLLGLRRAFRKAGARTVIMSLWAVDDGAARSWMRRLYEERLAGLSTAEAASRASVDMIETQRRRGHTTHPFFWGGFVAAGDWR